ncbi:glycine C-acetyltransferase [bacterium]|nr:glycine C-acetyltransferase [candidate division CSSED10-310 bacterium]
MAYRSFKAYLDTELEKIRDAGLYKQERIIHAPQAASVAVEYPEGNPCRPALNFCANNYLGLSSHPRIIQAAHDTLDSRGYGMSSVRFICGTQDIHRELETRLATFLHMDDAILYSSCFDANLGIFGALLTDQDALISDRLNHASIIDGIRLCKAKRYLYEHADMDNLEFELQQAQVCRHRLIVTDGVFSMDGDLAKLPKICDLADKYDALVMVDDSHATGFIGRTGRGTPEHFGVQDRIDIINSTLGKALGGAAGGFTAARQAIVDKLRQHSRPYLFSNSLSPVIAGTSIAVLNILDSSTELRDRLEINTRRFRAGIDTIGLRTIPGQHPIVPILLGHLPDDARLSQEFARGLYEEGIYAIGFYYPVVPQGQSRIRVQISASHTPDQIDSALDAFARVGKRLGAV